MEIRQGGRFKGDDDNENLKLLVILKFKLIKAEFFPSNKFPNHIEYARIPRTLLNR